MDNEASKGSKEGSAHRGDTGPGNAPGHSQSRLSTIIRSMAKYQLRGHVAWIVLFIVATAVLFLVTLQSYQDYRQIKKELRTNTTFSAELLSRNTARTLGEVVLGLEDVGQFIQEGYTSPIPISRFRIRERLASKIAQFPHVQAFFVVNRSGRIDHSVSVDPEFRIEQEEANALVRESFGSGAGLIFRTYRYGPSRAWRFVIGREIVRSGGKLDAVVAAVVEPRFFGSDASQGTDSNERRFLLSGDAILTHSRGSSLPVGGTVSSDLPMAANLPNSSSGTIETKGEDGQSWVLSFVRLPNHLLAAVSMVPRSEVWARWWPRRIPSFFLAGVTILLLVVYSWVTTRQMAGRAIAEDEIRDLNAKLEWRVEERTSELMESEERFRNMTANVPGAVYQQILMPDGSIEFPFISHGVGDITGYGPIELMAESTLLMNRIHEDDREDFVAAAKCAGEVMEPMRIDSRLNHKSGAVKWISSIARPRRRDDGAILFDGIMFDITDRKRSEDELKTAKEEADKANNAKSTFLANMSHELRTPLNAVIGMSEVMNVQAFGPLGSAKYLEYAGDINASGAHLLEIINSILDISAIENGALLPEDGIVKLSEVAESCLRLMHTRANEKSIILVADIADGLPQIRADERMMKQILLNLLSNAVKFTAVGGRVSIRMLVATDGAVVVRVEDSGIGIKEEDIKRVMQPFGQVEEWQSRKYEGTGLGLPLVKAMLDLHGGGFDLASEFGVGTVATARIPAERIIQEEREPASVNVR